MAKVIKHAYKFKPIKCSVCGCTYEHEEGDRIEICAYEIERRNYVVLRKLDCPVCGNDNNLELEGENENEK